MQLAYLVIVVNQNHVVMSACEDCNPTPDFCPEVSGPEVDESSSDCCTITPTDCVVTSTSDSFMGVGKGDNLTSFLKKISALLKSLKISVLSSVSIITPNPLNFNGVPLFTYTTVAGGTPVQVNLPMFLTGLYCFGYEISPGVPDTFTVSSTMSVITVYDSSASEIVDQAVIDDLMDKIRNGQTTNLPCTP